MRLLLAGKRINHYNLEIEKGGTYYALSFL